MVPFIIFNYQVIMYDLFNQLLYSHIDRSRIAVYNEDTNEDTNKDTMRIRMKIRIKIQ